MISFVAISVGTFGIAAAADYEAAYKDLTERAAAVCAHKNKSFDEKSGRCVTKSGSLVDNLTGALGAGGAGGLLDNLKPCPGEMQRVDGKCPYATQEEFEAARDAATAQQNLKVNPEDLALANPELITTETDEEKSADEGATACAGINSEHVKANWTVNGVPLECSDEEATTSRSEDGKWSKQLKCVWTNAAGQVNSFPQKFPCEASAVSGGTGVNVPEGGFVRDDKRAEAEKFKKICEDGDFKFIRRDSRFSKCSEHVCEIGTLNRGYDHYNEMMATKKLCEEKFPGLLVNFGMSSAGWETVDRRSCTLSTHEDATKDALACY